MKLKSLLNEIKKKPNVNPGDLIAVNTEFHGRQKYKIVNGPKFSTETDLWTVEIVTNNPDFPYWGAVYDSGKWYMGDYIKWIHDDSAWEGDTVDF